MKIGIGSDHAGFVLKKHLIDALKDAYEIKDFGTYSEERADYPDFAHPLAKSVEEKELEFGILICGSGNGIAMTANKHQGIRAAIAWLPEISELARQHNDANIICLPARFIDPELALNCVKVFLSTDFEGGRHATRVDKIACS